MRPIFFFLFLCVGGDRVDSEMCDGSNRVTDQVEEGDINNQDFAPQSQGEGGDAVEGSSEGDSPLRIPIGEEVRCRCEGGW